MPRKQLSDDKLSAERSILLFKLKLLDNKRSENKLSDNNLSAVRSILLNKLKLSDDNLSAVRSIFWQD